jgi:cytochrome P450
MDGLQKYSMFLYDIAQSIIDDRKENLRDPAEDPTSALLVAKDFDGDPLPDHLILGTIRQLLVVGIIAPTTFLGSVAVHFCRHPEHFQLMKDAPQRIPEIAEELLRLYTPYRGFARTPTRDVEINGQTIRRDEAVALCFTSANRDAEVFEDPDEFRLDRKDAPPAIAFGQGPHRCAGEPIGRLMLTASLEVFSKRCNGFEANGPTPMTTWPEYGPYSVPVKFR